MPSFHQYIFIVRNALHLTGIISDFRMSYLQLHIWSSDNAYPP
jgi:hypothetical protein